MEVFTDVLLVTANVGSLFDNMGQLQSKWLQELYKTIKDYKPQFIGLHFQEVGGKDYKTNMGFAEDFFRYILSSVEMKDYDRAHVYVDNYCEDENNFTALGSLYCIHKDLKNIFEYDFNVKNFIQVQNKTVHFGPLSRITTVEKEKFPKDFWPNLQWSRKGFMRTRWKIHNQDLDLVNVHLFHDVSNIVAYSDSPSTYCGNRQKALRHIISRISDSNYKKVPFFLFGDFNFRLDTHSLVKNLSDSPDLQTVTEKSNNEVQKVIVKEKNNDCQVKLQIEEKLFSYLQMKSLTENNGKELLQYDKEVAAFHDVIKEEGIQFPPSYPYSEDYTQPTEYMNTRCPAWCDRIIMSHSAKALMHKSDKKASVYKTIGPEVCMGDHKPVFLSFLLKTDQH